MTSRLILLVVLAFVFAACTPPEEASDDGLPGLLVILDRDGNVATVDPNGGDPARVAEADEAVYIQPVWSPDGTRIVWGQVTADGPATVLAEPDDQGLTVIPMINPPFYFYWAPDSRAVGVLHNSSGTGIDFEIVDVARGEAAVVDQGVPYYFSWSPDGNEIVVHVGAERLATIDKRGAGPDVGVTSSGYLAPQWVSGGIIHVAEGALVIETEDGQVPLALLSGAVTFVANPEGSLVAVQWLGEEEGTPAVFRPEAVEVSSVPANKVVVVDTGTGKQTVAFDGPAVGLFWSPDGQRVLILSVSASGAALEPFVWERSEGTSAYPAFVPHGSFVREVLPFFPQYAQSLNLWAPDSSAFAYAGEIEGDQGIWIQELAATHPRLVAEGTWVAWSLR